MHLGRVRGTVVATVKTPTLGGQRLLWVEPFTWAREPEGPGFAAVDRTGAGPGTWGFYVQGREAANALDDKFNPSDRAIVGIVDAVTLEARGAEGD